MLFGATADESCDSYLPALVEIERAWTVMMVGVGQVDAAEAVRLLDALDTLEASGFSALREREPERGAFLLYEQVLATELSVPLAGDLQRARSRNDLNAAIVRLQLRRPVARLCLQMLRLVGTIRRLACRTGDYVFPVYTHGQQALAGSVGHYLNGVAEELLLDLGWLMRCWEELQRSPLGAGVACGTALPIDAEDVARLLGFDAPVVNSLRAVASRRLVLELLAAASMVAVTLSRVGLDLMSWCSEEQRFGRLPDRLVGSSSHLPQKRNLFLLEHVQARAASAQGGFATAALAMTSKPFTNSVAVGTEAVRAVWAPLSDVGDTVVILRSILQGLELDRVAMEHRASGGAAAAADFAELLVAQGTAFRDAHRQVGELVTAAEHAGTRFQEAAVAEAERRGIADARAYLTPKASMQRREQGGGTGPTSLRRQLDSLAAGSRLLRRRLHTVRQHHRVAAATLRGRVDDLRHRAQSTSSAGQRKETS